MRILLATEKNKEKLYLILISGTRGIFPRGVGL
jgi:hypothetical protein